jgi:hypothetical protein
MFHVIVIMLKGASGVVRWVYVDALHLSGVEGEQGFQGFEVVALNYEVTGVAVSVAVLLFLHQQAVFGVGSGLEVLFAG